MAAKRRTHSVSEGKEKRLKVDGNTELQWLTDKCEQQHQSTDCGPSRTLFTGRLLQAPPHTRVCSIDVAMGTL